MDNYEYETICDINSFSDKIAELATYIKDNKPVVGSRDLSITVEDSSGFKNKLENFFKSTNFLCYSQIYSYNFIRLILKAQYSCY